MPAMGVVFVGTMACCIKNRSLSRRSLLATITVGILAWLPSIVGGEMINTVRYFCSHGSDRGWWEAILVVRSALFPGLNANLQTVACIGMLCGAVVAYIATRDRPFEKCLLLLCFGLLLVLPLSVQRIVGPVLPHAVMWMCTVSLLTLLASGGFIAQRLHGRIPATLALLLLSGLSIANTRTMADVLPAFVEDSDTQDDILDIATAAEDAIKKDGGDGGVFFANHDSWAATAGVILLLEKRGFTAHASGPWAPITNPPGTAHPQLELGIYKTTDGPGYTLTEPRPMSPFAPRK